VLGGQRAPVPYRHDTQLHFLPAILLGPVLDLDATQALRPLGELELMWSRPNGK